MEIDLTGHTVLDIYGTSQEDLKGAFTATALADRFISSWIPYMECHKCGKADYCKFAQPHPTNEHKKKEIQCGVGQTAIRNFVERTFSIFAGLDAANRQAYLDGSYYLLRFILGAEQSIGGTIDQDYLNWLGKYAPSTFGRLTHLRDDLNLAAGLLGKVPGLNSERSLLLVEGWAEKAFLDKLKESHMAWFLYLLIECYDGKGNRRSKRIAMLLKKYIDLGYVIYAQGDADGKPEEIFKHLVDAKHLAREHTFTFAYDFESSVPVPLLIDALKIAGAEVTFKAEEVEEALREAPQSVNSLLLKKFGLDTDPLKMEVASALGELLNGHDFIWWNDEAFMKSELGCFLRFIQEMA